MPPGDGPAPRGQRDRARAGPSAGAGGPQRQRGAALAAAVVTNTAPAATSVAYAQAVDLVRVICPEIRLPSALAPVQGWRLPQKVSSAQAAFAQGEHPASAGALVALVLDVGEQEADPAGGGVGEAAGHFSGFG